MREPSTRPIRSRLRSGRLVAPIVIVATLVFLVAELRPGLLFGPGLDVGGDNAAHVVAVYYFIHQLLPHGSLSGWDPQWFDGFPLYVFYFPLPPLLIAGLNAVFTYAVAFKLVTMLGIVLMPVGAYVLGRGAGFARPIPELMGVAMLPFIFSPYYPYQIDGGNLLSTLAGEFSFTLSQALALFFLGVTAYTLRTGRLRWLAAVLFVATLLCHVVPALFAGVGAVALALVCRRVRAIGRVAVIGVVGTALGAFWLLPFGADLRYSSCMCYTRVPVGVSVFPHTPELAMQVLALGGALIAIARRDRFAIALVGLAVFSFAAFALLPSGVIYNGRWLPFWFCTTDLLAGYGVARAGGYLLRRLRLGFLHPNATAIGVAVVVIALCAFFLGNLPGVTTPTRWQAVDEGWLEWNYTGYQAKTDYVQYVALTSMLERAGKRYGCGRLDYEYSPNTTDAFGSTLVDMAFPYFTNGCIDTTEGVYYESSTTTPFHFLDQAELSIDPSNPMVGIPYQTLNVADGIRHLQLQGVQYFLACSPTVELAAAEDPALTEIAEMPEDPGVADGPTPSATDARWVLYKIADSALVAPLSYAPVVESGMSKSAWLDTAIAWYQDEPTWVEPIATTGPSSWPRAAAGALVDHGLGPRLPAVKISSIVTSDASISFHVSRTGVPVVVRIPFFPNWHATGATGPFLSTPNLMVVVPTAHTVRLTYGADGANWLGRAISAGGVVGLGALIAPVVPFPPVRRSAPEIESPLGDADEHPEDEDAEAEVDRVDDADAVRADEAGSR